MMGESSRNKDIEPSSAAQSVANAKIHLKLSLSRAKLREEVRPAIALMRDLTNNDDAGSSSRFAKPSEREKSAQGVIPSSTEATLSGLSVLSMSTALFCGVPEKVIAEISGHRSTKALRCYERTSEKLQQAVTKVINNPTT